MKASELISVDENDTAAKSAGSLVYWRLEGELDPAELRVVWTQAGLDPALMPSTPSPSTALARALAGERTRRRLLRPLDERGSYALVNESAHGDELEHKITVKAKLDVAGRVVFEPLDHPLGPSIKAAYERALDVCSASDIAAWLVGLSEKVGGVAMRDRGGVYYIPPDKAEKWNAMMTALRAVSEHRIFRIPVMRASDAVEAILDAIEQEAAAEAAAMEGDLQNEACGKRALASRVGRCELIQTKVSRYELLLGRRLPTLQNRLERLSANIAAAILTATADEG